MKRAAPKELRQFTARRGLYQSSGGPIMRCTVGARLVLGFAADYLSRFNTNPTVEHLKAAKRVLLYLEGTLALGLVFGLGKSIAERLVGCSDSNFSGDLDSRRCTLDSRRGTTGLVFRHK